MSAFTFAKWEDKVNQAKRIDHNERKDIGYTQYDNRQKF